MAKLKDGFYKQTAESVGSDLYVLLAGGGSKPLSDFATASDIPTATNYYWADLKITSTASFVTTPTVSSITATSLFYLKSDDATLKIYPIAGLNSNDYGNEAVAMQTCFDGKDPSSSDYVTDYSTRTVLSLQPRGGRVGIGTTIPQAKLDIVGDVKMLGEVMSLAGDTSGADTNADSPKLWLGAMHYSLGWYTGSYIQALRDGGYGNHTLSFFTKESSDYSTAPVERMRITKSGNVLIGHTADSSTRLQVKQNLDVFDDGDYSGVIGFNRKSQTGGLYNTAYAGWQIHNYLGALQFYIQATSGPSGVKMTLTDKGNVGIGTTGPQAKLDVLGIIFGNQYNASGNKAGAGLILNKGTNFVGMGPSGSSVERFSVGTVNIDGTWIKEIITLEDSGNVGIGTTNPENTFDINGIQQIYQRGNDNTAFKDLLLLKQQNSTELSQQNWDTSQPSFGIGFRRYWTSGNLPYGETTHAGIYSTVSSNWRGGLVFRTKNNETQGGTHDTTALRLRPDGHAIFGNSIETNGTITSHNYHQIYNSGSYTKAAANVTGAIVIQLPIISSQHDMVNVEIAVYEYNSQAASKIIVGGHPWKGAWYNHSCSIIGGYSRGVRLGIYGGKWCIILGTSSTVWQYPGVFVTHIGTVYDDYSSVYTSQCTLSLVTSESNFSALVTPTNIVNATYATSAGSATYARYVIADNNAQSPGYALLQSGSGRADASPGGDTWIYWDTLGGTTSPWGFKHEQADNYISFYGAGSRRTYINLTNGYVYAKGFYHLDYGSSAYALTSNGGVAHIGSMSVNYANSSGNADTVDNLHATDFMPASGGYISGTTVADVKTNLLNYFKNKPATTNAYTSSTFVSNFGNDSYTILSSSVCGWIALNPGYDNYNHGHFLVSEYGNNRLRHVGLGYNTWYGPYTIAYTSDIPTKLSQLTNDRGFVTGGPYLPLAGGTMTGNITFGDGAQGAIKYGTHTTSALKGITLPSLGSAGIGIFSRAGKSTDEGGIVITEDTCLIYNSFDSGWGFSVHDKDLNQTDISADATKVFGITQTGYYAWSRGGFKKEGSSDSYVLLGGGGHKAESSLSVSYATSAGSASSAGYAGYITSADTRNDEITPSTYGPSLRVQFKSNGKNGMTDGGNFYGIMHFRPYGGGGDFSGGYPHLLAFTENSNIWYRKATSSTNWGNWKRIAFTSDIPTSLPANGGNADTTDGVHLEWSGSQAAADTTWLAGWTNDGTKLKAVKRADLSVNYATSAGSAGYLYGSTPLLCAASESDNITIVANNNSAITTNSPMNLAAIRKAIDFKWYNTHWLIGNIRSGSTESAGFGITYGGTNLRFRVTTDACYVGSNVVIHTGNIGSQSVNYATSSGSASTATQLTYKDFNFTAGTKVADYAKATTCSYNAGTFFSTSGWAWASSSNLDVGGYTVDRMRYSAVVYRNGNLNSQWQQHAIMFIPTYSDSNMIYLAQMTTTDQLTVSTSVKRYLDYDSTYSNIYNALVNGYASSAGYASTVAVSDSDANSNYRMVWHSGNYLYGTGGIYCNPNTDTLHAKEYVINHTATGPSLTISHSSSSYLWSYIRQISNSYEWHIGICSGVNGSDNLYNGSYEIRGNGGTSYNGIVVRYNTSSYGKLVVANSSSTETSIGYLNTKFNSTYPIWTVGAGIGGSTTCFGWHYYNTNCKMYLTTEGRLYATAFYETSDIRLKTNVKKLSKDLLDSVYNINEVSFNWKESGKEAFGYIALDYESISEMFIGKNSDGTLSLNYTEALVAQIAALKLKIANLEERLHILERS